MFIDASQMDFKTLNERIRGCAEDVRIGSCGGQRFIGAGFTKQKIEIFGVPGNALGAYLNGAEIIVRGNAQDAVGDTMNSGKIVVHGSIGDAAGYAMRGGKLYIRGDAGYRAGIHMKEYRDKCPVIVIGGKCGSFLGEYQAGGRIVVLGLTQDERRIVSNFPCTGMHGGKVFLRCAPDAIDFPKGVTVSAASDDDLAEIRQYVDEFAQDFLMNAAEIMDAVFTVVVPDSKNPYKQMYVAN